MIQRFPVDIGATEPITGCLPGIAPVIGGVSLPIRTIGPDLGEHTRQVLASVHRLTDDEIDAGTGTAETGVTV